MKKLSVALLLGLFMFPVSGAVVIAQENQQVQELQLAQRKAEIYKDWDTGNEWVACIRAGDNCTIAT